jgi:hypothetical protein
MSFLIDIWDPGAKYHCLSIKESDGTWRDQFFTSSQWRDIPAWVRENAASNLYFCPHPFEVRRRLSDCAVDSRWLWADLDEIAPQTLTHRPTVAWRTSRGKYAALWGLDHAPSRGLRKGFNLQLGVEGGRPIDPGHHLTKLLRLPGTLNWKYDPPQRVVALWDDGPRYKVSDLLKYKVAAPEGEAVPVHIEGIDGREVCKKYGCWQLLSAIEDKIAVTRRSSVVWKIGKTLREKGASRDEVAAAIYASVAWREKHGADSGNALAEEVKRVFAG